MKPILFSTPMVQAILEGRKTMTRRIVKPQPSIKMGVGKWLKNKVLQMIGDQSVVTDYMEKHNPYGQPGDILWVREKWMKNNRPMGWPYFFYANNEDFTNPDYEKWKPSIFMPKDACRLFLKIKSVRVERLQDISEQDAKAEGIKPVQSFDSGEGVSKTQMYENYLPAGYTEVLPKDSFQSLWRSINGTESWDANPWVWVVEFEQTLKP